MCDAEASFSLTGRRRDVGDSLCQVIFHPSQWEVRTAAEATE